MISQALHFAGSARGDEKLSLKVLESLARQRDQDARDRCYDVLKALPSECFVIIDESSIDRRTLRRRRGWAPVNKPARLYELFTVPGAGLRSLIAAVNSEGFVLPACKLLHDGVTDEALYEWAEECLIPILNPFDHDNPKKNSILVLDNAVIHHSPSFVSLLDSTKCLVIYLSPYSPDLSAVEPCFHQVKQHMRRNRAEAAVDLDRALFAAMAAVTPTNMRGYFRMCGYRRPRDEVEDMLRDEMEDIAVLPPSKCHFVPPA